jgi:DNA anti-recombination protein RmuC
MHTSFFTGPYIDLAEQIKAQDEGWRRLARAAGEFLNVTFPGHATEVANLQEALASLMCAGTEQQLKALEEHAQMVRQQQRSMQQWEPPSLEESLISLIEARDKLSGQIEAVREGMKEMPEKVRGMMQATAIDPLEDQLKHVEEQISRTQSAMESTTGAADA